MTFRWGEHVGELELHVEAADEHGVFAEAVHALNDLLRSDATGPPERHEITAEANDRAGLWAAWLEEINFPG